MMRAWGCLLVFVFVLAVLPAAGASTKVLLVEVDEPFVVGGRIFGPASVSFHPGAPFTPGVGFDEIRVNGTSLGLVPVRTDDRGPVADDAAVFARDDNGRLVLLGYVLRGGSGGHRRLLGQEPESPTEVVLAR